MLILTFVSKQLLFLWTKFFNLQENIIAEYILDSVVPKDVFRYFFCDKYIRKYKYNACNYYKIYNINIVMRKKKTSRISE